MRKRFPRKIFAKQRAFRSKPSAVGKIEKLIRQHRWFLLSQHTLGSHLTFCLPGKMNAIRQILNLMTHLLSNSWNTFLHFLKWKKILFWEKLLNFIWNLCPRIDSPHLSIIDHFFILWYILSAFTTLLDCLPAIKKGRVNNWPALFWFPLTGSH